MTPTQGMGDLGKADVILDGKQLTLDVSEAINDIQLTRTISGASTVALNMIDTDRSILRSGIFDHRVTLQLDGLRFHLVQPAKAGDLLTCTFEDEVVALLRRTNGRVTAAAGSTTRAGFARRLVRQTPGVKFISYPGGQTLKEPLTRGTKQSPHEDTWTCLQRLAAEVQWRCFSDGTAVWFGPDSWLMSLPSQATLRELTEAVSNIDFDFDTGKPVTNITVTMISTLWGIPPGAVATVADAGVINGDYLVSQLTRSLFVQPATATLTAPQKALKEPSGASSSSSAAVPTGADAKTPNAKAGIAVRTAQAQLGVPYVWSGASPSGFDCSGLTQFCYAKAGVSLPHFAATQFADGPKVKGALAPGDLVFFVGSDGTPAAPGHVGIYIGGGRMIDAPYPGVDVRVDTVADAGNYVGATRPSP